MDGTPEMSRTGRNNPDSMDLWLESQGYCRKPIARDGSCLFRAFAEQVMKSQKFHMDVRNECVNFMKKNVNIFDGHKLEGDIDTYLKLMLIPSQWGGMLEIKALSVLYQVDVFLFREVGILAQNVTQNSFSKSVMLCLSPEQQYEPVYSKEFTKTAAFCQSLVYEILYKKVFHMKDVDFAVDQMLHNKANNRNRGEFGASVHRKFFSFGGNSLLLQRRGISFRNLIDNVEDEVNIRDLLSKGVTPFPYKVAKSLDPNVYRNVELDVWIDYKRGLRFFGSHNELRVGVKCFVKIDDATCVAHIQEMEPNCGPVLVFVEELGEKRSVPYESLELMPQELQAVKPLPLLSSGNQRVINNISKSGVFTFQDYSKSLFIGNKFRKRRSSGDEIKGKENANSSFVEQSGAGSRKGRIQSKSDIACNKNNIAYREENLSSFQNFTVDAFNDTFPPSYQTYQLKANMDSASGVSLSTQTHVFMQSQQLGSPPILIPVSPRPEDIPSHWLQTSHPMEPMVIASAPSGTECRTYQEYSDPVMTAPFLGLADVPSGPSNVGSGADLNQSLQLGNDFSPAAYSSTPSDQVNVTVQEPSNQDSFQDNSVPPEVDLNSNYMPDANLESGQINYNAPKSVLESGADLPLTDIQTLRFFYNLGNEVYHANHAQAQYGMYSYGNFTQGYSQPCASSTPSPGSPAPGMCPGKFCPCGPVCITTVPTIHQLLEPSTPPPNPRRRGKDCANSSTGSAVTEANPPTSRSTPQPTSGSMPRLNKKDSKGKGRKDLKVYQGQPLQQSSSVGTSSTLSSNSQNNNEGERECDSLQLQDSEASLSVETSTNALAVPFSPSYSYVYCPSSPGVSFSSLDTDTYFTPLRLQCPREYLPDTPQSPPCFSLGGEVYTSQIPMFPSSPHYLFPASPGIYVGSPPPWTPITPPPATQ